VCFGGDSREFARKQTVLAAKFRVFMIAHTRDLVELLQENIEK